MSFQQYDYRMEEIEKEEFILWQSDCASLKSSLGIQDLVKASFISDDICGRFWNKWWFLFLKWLEGSPWDTRGWKSVSLAINSRNELKEGGRLTKMSKFKEIKARDPLGLRVKGPTNYWALSAGIWAGGTGTCAFVIIWSPIPPDAHPLEPHSPPLPNLKPRAMVQGDFTGWLDSYCIHDLD